MYNTGRSAFLNQETGVEYRSNTPKTKHKCVIIHTEEKGRKMHKTKHESRAEQNRPE